MHYHEYIEILYALDGNFLILLNGEVKELPQGSMYVIKPNEPHCTKSASEGERTLICIKFIPEVLFSSGQTVAETEYTLPYIFENLGNKRVFSCEELKDSFIPEEFNFLKNEKTNAKFGYEIAIRSSVLRIFSFVLRYWYESAGSPDLAANQKNLTAIRKIRQYVKENYVTVTLTDASNQCGLSYSYFSRLFNSVMNMGFSEYLTSVRLAKAEQLLVDSDKTITEIAYGCGFSTSSYFIMKFKEKNGIPPLGFRKKIKL
jgi:AraC-like DNA-binding protein